MAMLAERKRKQKWSLNPRGQLWSNDSNKFGQKMLEKMGWSSGKGLGANEDGIQEHIKISHKNDCKGMGYKETDDQWTSHESNFSALLQSLGSDNSEDTASVEIKNSLELKSQSSKKRVHYHKFTRGKDLTRYSEKDLANIFGRKTLKKTKKGAEEEEEEEKSEVNGSSNLLSRGSMFDYFRKKLPNMGSSSFLPVTRNEENFEERSEEKENSDYEEKPHFGFGFSSKSEETDIVKTKKMTFVSYINEVDTIKESPKVSKKRRHDEEIEENCTEIPKKKKKKTKGNVEDGINNLTNEENGIEDICEEKFEDSENSNKKKKKKSKSKETDNFIIENEEKGKKNEKNGKKNEENGLENPSFKDEDFEGTVEENPYQVTVKSKKKKKKGEEINLDKTEETCEEKTKKNKKKRKCEKEDGLENPNFEVCDESREEIKENPYEVKLKKKKPDENLNEKVSEEKTKKNKKKIKSEQGLENPNFEEIDESIEHIQENPYEVKLKKKKKKTKVELDIENPYEVKIKEKQKKNQKEENNNFGMENPNFRIEASENSTSSEYEVKRKKKKKSKYEESFCVFENPALNFEESKVNEEENITKENEETTTSCEYEVKRKKKKKTSKIKDTSFVFENPTLNLEDSKENINEDTNKNQSISVVEDIQCDFILNVQTTPIIKTPARNNNLSTQKQRKSVRFSNINEERIIPSKEEMLRNELYDINTKVIENGLEEEKKSFDMSELDKVSFYEKKSPINGKKGPSRVNGGLENAGFDEKQVKLRENIDNIAKKLNDYQSEIENDINEAKDSKIENEDVYVGDVGSNLTENVRVGDDVKMAFSLVDFDKKSFNYYQGATGPKRAYKQLIKGDILLKFPNCNLHEINGYSLKSKNRIR